MKKIIILILFLNLTFLAFADKGWNVAINKITKEIVEASYGDSGYQHLIAAGYTVVRGIPSDIFENLKDLSDYHWVDINTDNEVQQREIIKKSQDVILLKNIRNKKKELQGLIVSLTNRKNSAVQLGFSELANEIQVNIDKLNIELQK